MAFALNRTNVPDGSVWYSTGPSLSSTPARSSATPYGRLCGATDKLSSALQHRVHPYAAMGRAWQRWLLAAHVAAHGIRLAAADD